MPLQHASDAVLKRMKRPTGRGNLLRHGRARPRSACPAWPSARRSSSASRARRTPSSTSCCAFVRGGASSTTSGVFTFSDEEGTTSFDLAGRVPPARQGAAPQAAAAGRAEADLGRAATGAGWGSASRCWWRAPTRTATCCCGAAWPPRRPRSTGRHHQRRHRRRGHLRHLRDHRGPSLRPGGPHRLTRPRPPCKGLPALRDRLLY